MQNARIKNTVANVGIKNTPLSVRVSSFQTGILSDGATTQYGTPLGLLLALTRVVTTSGALIFRGDYRPNVKII